VGDLGEQHFFLDLLDQFAKVVRMALMLLGGG